MKLNNRGWGLQAMLSIVLILMLALILVVILIEKNFGELVGGEATSVKLEEKVVTATKKYQKKYYSDATEQHKVTVEKLIEEGMLDKLSYKGTACTGYANFTQNEYHAYVKCGSKYTTKGYK